MELTKEQKRQLKKMGEYFKEIEKKSSPENLELDVFMSEYNDAGVLIYKTEKVDISGKARSRKEEFLNAGKQKEVKKLVN